MLGNARIVSIFMLISQLVAFFRTAIIASLFGASSIVDAYNLGLSIPILLSGVIGGWLQAGFVGRYMERNREPNSSNAATFRTAMGLVLIAITFTLSLGMVLTSHSISQFLAPTAHEQAHIQTVAAIKIIGWSLVPTVLSDYITLLLACHGKFIAASAAPVVNAIVAAAGLLIWPTHTLDSLLWTLVAGLTVQLVILIITLTRIGLPFSLSGSHLKADIVATLKVAFPLLPAVVFSNGTQTTIQVFCSRLGEGAVAIYGYASKLHGALTQIIVVGISTVLLPHLAGMLAEGRREEIRLLMGQISRASLLVSLFVVIGVMLLGENTISVLLGRGRFDQRLTLEVSHSWLLLSLSIFPFALSTFFAKLFQAMQRPILLSTSSFLSFIITSFTCWIGLEQYGLSAVMLAPFSAQTAVLCFFTWKYREQFDEKRLLRDWIKTIGFAVLIFSPAIAVDTLGLKDFSPINAKTLFFSRALIFVAISLFIAKLFNITRWIREGNTP